MQTFLGRPPPPSHPPSLIYTSGCSIVVDTPIIDFVQFRRRSESIRKTSATRRVNLRKFVENIGKAPRASRVVPASYTSCSRVSTCRTHNLQLVIPRKPLYRLCLRPIDDPASLQRLRTAFHAYTTTCGSNPKHSTIPHQHRRPADVFSIFYTFIPGPSRGPNLSLTTRHPSAPPEQFRLL